MSSSVATPVHLYRLWFRQGANVSPMSKHFESVETDTGKLVQRGKAHCDVMGYRFLRVEPFISSLEEDEKRHVA